MGVRDMLVRAPFLVSIGFFVVAVAAAGLGRYVAAIVSLIAGLATLSYGASVGRGGDEGHGS